MILISVYDMVARTWSNPVAAQNASSAVRDFLTACKDDRSLLGQHPDDFVLYEVGEWIVPSDERKNPIFTARDPFKILSRGSKTPSDQ